MKQSSTPRDGSISIYADGLDLDSISRYLSFLNGLTFNPTLFRKMGVRDYLGFCRDLVERYPQLPISLEVVADDTDGMIRQGLLLSGLGDNVWVKIPVVNTKGEYSTNVLNALSVEGVKLNVTALFTPDQCRKVSESLDGDREAILSVFAGRIFDSGVDAGQIVSSIVEWRNLNFPHLKILWASPRMVFDVITAEKSGADIITLPEDLLKKIDHFGRSLDEFSRDTVSMFYRDAAASNYSF
jgi:transaldolase